MYPYQRLLEEGYDVKDRRAFRRRSSISWFTISSRDMTHTPRSRVTALGRRSCLRRRATWRLCRDRDSRRPRTGIHPQRPEFPKNRSAKTSSVAFLWRKICHAALGLVAVGSVNRARAAAAYPALEADVQAAGAEFVNSEAVVDGVMVSARAWPDHPAAWMREFIKISAAGGSDPRRGCCLMIF